MNIQKCASRKSNYLSTLVQKTSGVSTFHILVRDERNSSDTCHSRKSKTTQITKHFSVELQLLCKEQGLGCTRCVKREVYNAEKMMMMMTTETITVTSWTHSLEISISAADYVPGRIFLSAKSSRLKSQALFSGIN